MTETKADAPKSEPKAQTVTVKNPAYARGYELELPALGLVKNYEAKDVAEVQIIMYRQAGYEFPKQGNLVLDGYGGEVVETDEETS